MDIRGILYGRTPAGHEEPGEAGVCPRCEHTPTPRYRLSWVDKLMKTPKSTQACTAQTPDICMCQDSYHYRHFL